VIKKTTATAVANQKECSSRTSLRGDVAWDRRVAVDSNRAKLAGFAEKKQA
jgi:hypothetical protein